MATITKEEFDRLNLCDTCVKSWETNPVKGSQCDAYSDVHACGHFGTKRCVKYIPLEKNNDKR